MADHIRARQITRIYRRSRAAGLLSEGALLTSRSGYPEGVYRVGPLARLNVADRCGTPLADAEFAEFRQRAGYPAQSAFHFHYARLVEASARLEKMELLLQIPLLTSTFAPTPG